MPDKTPDKRLFYKLNTSHRLLLKYVDREVRKRLGIPVAQSAALQYLVKNDGCLIKDLNSALLQNKSATTTLIERMVKNDLVVRRESETDGRATHVFLTDKGRQINKQVRPLIAELSQGLLDRFTEDEVAVVHKFLDTILENYR